MSVGRVSAPYSRGLLYGGLASIIGVVFVHVSINFSFLTGFGLPTIAQYLALILLSMELGNSASNRQPETLVGYILTVTAGSTLIGLFNLIYTIYSVEIYPTQPDMFLRLLRPLQLVGEPLVMATVGVGLGYTLNYTAVLPTVNSSSTSLTEDTTSPQANTDTQSTPPTTDSNSRSQDPTPQQQSTSGSTATAINGVALEGTITVKNDADKPDAFIVRVRNTDDVLFKDSVELDAGESHAWSSLPPVGSFEVAAKSRRGATTRTTVSNDGAAPTDVTITATTDTLQLETQ